MPVNHMCSVPVAACTSPSFPASVIALVKASSLGFRGTVTQLNATTEPGVSAQYLPRTAVIRVDVVLAGMPGSSFLGSFVGKEITVLFAGPPPVTVGYDGYFFAQGWLVGTAIAVTETGHTPPAAYPGIETMVPQIQKVIADRALYDLMTTASAIVVGTVSGTRSVTGPPGPVSEHDPMWTEALVNASCALKGPASASPLVVRFAASDDVAWTTSPKLAASQVAAFILASDTVTKIPGAAYMAVNALAVQPTSAVDSMSALLQCPPPAL